MFCTWCGAENREGAVYCRSCGRPLQPPPSQTQEEKPRRRVNLALLIGGGVAALVCLLAIVAVVATSALLLRGGRGGPIAFVDHDGNIATVHPDGSDLQVLTDDAGEGAGYTAPSWSPDHRWLAAYRYDWSSNVVELWIARSNGQDARTISLRDSPSLSIRPTWSPDGQSIAVLTEYGDFIYIIETHTGDTRYRIGVEELGHGSTEFPPVWTPDGRRLALTLLEDEYGNRASIYTVRPDGSDLQRMRVEEEDDIVALPLFSPDGDRLAYVTYNDDEEVIRLYIADADGSDAELIRMDGVPLQWSSDGRSLLLTDQFGENMFVYSLRSRRFATVQLEDPQGWWEVLCALSPDGESLACCSYSEISIYDLESGESEPLADGCQPAW